jgi:hypothetical protein
MRSRRWTFVAVAVGCLFGAVLYQRHATHSATRAADRDDGLAAAVTSQAGHRHASAATHRATSDALRAREADAETLGRFDVWAAGFLALTNADARRAALPEGIAAATARREVLRDLISSDPELALRRAVPWGVRAGLPAEVLPLLEDRVDGVGTYHALGALAPSASTSGDGFVAVRRQVEMGGRVYEAYTYGRRLGLGSRASLAVHGIAVDGRLALSDSPVRALESGEPIPAGRRVESVCAVSGRATEPETAALAVDTGDRVIYLCSAGHIGPLASHLESTEQDGGGGSTTSTAGANEVLASGGGSRRVLMIRVRFADQPGWFEPETQASATAMFAATDAFYRENSYGSLGIEGTVTPVYTLPQTAAWYTENDTSRYALNVLNAARAVAADPASAPGNEGLVAFNYLDYEFEAVRYTTGPGMFSGQGYVAMRGCWIKSSDAGVLIHELGHNLGLWHANAWAPADPLVPLGAGSNVEYGDMFDTMGPARGGSWHFNTWEKRHLGWLAAADIATATATARVTLGAQDLGTAPADGRARALRITRDDDRDYWVEFRRHPAWLSARPGVHDGVTLRWDPWARSNGGTQLIDATPGSPDGRDDATLTIGRTFSDPAAGIHITPVAVNAADGSAVELDVQIGAFPGNRQPTATIMASASEVAAGQSVQFSVSASDADGDALSFSWSFDDSGDTKAGASVSRSWTTEGDHRARVTVSDRRGGVASSSVIVRVGASVGSRIRGRVVDLGGQPVSGVFVHNGTEPGADGYRSAWSDSDGSFTLVGVPPGTWQLAASAPGWMFAVDGFSHPVVTPGAEGEVTLRGCWAGFAISGTVRRVDGTPVAGALVRLGDRVEPTDASGEFSLTGLDPGRHVLAVEAVGAVFDARTVDLGLADIRDVFLSERTFTLAGTVNAAGPASVTVTTGWQSTTVTVGSGSTATPARFSLPGVPGGSWALRAVGAGSSFSAEGFAPPLAVAADTAGLALVADPVPRYAISGVVRDRGLGVAGATVTVGGKSTITDSRGGYWLGGLAAGHYDVSASTPGLDFASGTRSVDVVGADVSGIDFSTGRTNLAPTFSVAPHAIGPVNRPFVVLAASASDDDPEGLLRYWWTVVGDAPGEVDFAATGANAARETVARFPAPGDYRVRVTAVDRHGAEHSGEFLLAVRGESGPPVIVEAARAEPAVVGAALETRLSVRASSDAGDERLSYTWSVDAAAPGPVAFLVNGSNAARETTARFRAPGNYLLRVIVRDPAGRAVESSVAVRVEITFASWLSAYFEPAIVADAALRASVWGELADPDGDGIANLLEYAFGGDPLVASTDTRPQTHFVTEGGVEYLAVTFRPNPGAIDLIFEPQVSSDLETWQGGAVFVPGPDDRVLTYRDFSPASAHQRRFIRVNVSTALQE